ncbi:MAG: hypothetical protein GF331_15600 [Chitinivibrionales bacterium]|nr:hypothetical protein [Chitinivibrionales bacterium]
MAAMYIPKEHANDFSNNVDQLPMAYYSSAGSPLLVSVSGSGTVTGIDISLSLSATKQATDLEVLSAIRRAAAGLEALLQ